MGKPPIKVRPAHARRRELIRALKEKERARKVYAKMVNAGRDVSHLPKPGQRGAALVVLYAKYKGRIKLMVFKRLNEPGRGSPIFGTAGKGKAWEANYETAIRELDEELPVKDNIGRKISERIQLIREIYSPNERAIRQGYRTNSYLARVDYNTLKMIERGMKEHPKRFKELAEPHILDINELEHTPLLYSFQAERIRMMKKRILEAP